MAWGTIIGITLMAFLILQTATLADKEWCVVAVAPGAQEGPLQAALDWVCSDSGGQANCTAIQPGGDCFLPNTIWDHASYAFNDYWQEYRNGKGARCEFNGLAIKVLTDPSHDNCHFTYEKYALIGRGKKESDLAMHASKFVSQSQYKHKF